MRLNAALSGDLRKLLAEEVRAAGTAVASAIKAATLTVTVDYETAAPLS